MKNNTSVAKISGTALLLMGMLFAVVIATVPQSAQAADYYGDSGNWSTDSGTAYYDNADTGGNWYTDSGTGYYDNSGAGNWSTDSGTAYYDNAASYNGSGYGGYSYGASTLGGMSSYGYQPYGYSASTLPGNTNVNTNTNTWDNGNTYTYAPTDTKIWDNGNTYSATCTAPNSCNTTSTYDDHSIFNAPTNIVTNPAPVVINNAPAATPVAYAPQPQPQPIYYPQYQQPSYPVYNAQPVYRAQPVVQPYVTLAAVPYTGLELGTFGTIAYWGFLVLWCLLAAYLIAVKKVQNRIAAWFTGASTTPSHSTRTTHAAHHAVQAPVAFAAPAAPKVQYSGIDPFIQGQINRAK